MMTMHEEKFVLIENKEMTLRELASELEAITGYTVTDSFGDINRIVAQKPNFDDEFETFLVTYEFNETDDIVDATVTTPRNEKIDFKTDTVKVRLLSYKSR
ncbi:hypothetical protein ERX27_00715 [Macrococcus brunensis]|uniref:Uncharacterized protein n=2 Tax=Macrococcus brunensis TaxID=198483 RepID=A0A4R6BGF7_9STAP|nr:hypothetical protein [Macrococcus brunensis]TDL98997.1 hypothetical protein ERX27_00715 [Macrococcus brunensis]ULG74726.1 hypothetical protein MGG13_02870 [Macrococcus brunensis]